MTIRLLIPCAILIQLSLPAMEEKKLSDDLEKKCTLSPTISRKRANTTILEFMEAHDELLKKVKEKRSKSISELEQKIKQGEIIPYRVGVTMNDATPFCQNSYIIKKNVMMHANEQGLITVELYVLAAHERMLLEDPLVKIYARLQGLLTITKTLD